MHAGDFSAMPPHISLLDPNAAAQHRCRLLAVARGLTGSPQLAEDLTQETYARVLAKPRRLSEGGADFPYLVRALRNVANDHWRSEQRRPQVVGEIDEDHPSLSTDRNPADALIASEVYTHVNNLPEDFRKVVQAVDVLGLSYGQTARQLRIPPGTVMSRLSRGRSRLAFALTA
jgi:RNA polymerase sigma-70 factor (ECF subfamily)